MINKKRLIKLTQKLIQINSENPPADTRQISRFVKKYLEDLGLKVRVFEFKKNIINLVARVGSGKRSLIVSPHLDTVPAGRGWRFNPLAAKIKNGKIYGRGATDCKSNTAVLLEAIKSLIEDGVDLEYNLILVFTADEETGSNLGFIPLLDRKKISADEALILDSDEFDIIVAQKGLIHFTVKIFGRKAHGAYNWRGVNAIELASAVIQELKRARFKSLSHKLLRPLTVNIGKIHGGEKVNVVADYCEFEVDLRFLPGMKPKKIMAKVKGLIKKHAKKFKIEIQSIQMPYEINKKHSLVIGLLRSAANLGVKSHIKGSEGATVSTFFQHHNIPAVATGYGSHNCAHAANEYVKIYNLYKGALVLEDFLKKH